MTPGAPEALPASSPDIALAVPLPSGITAQPDGGGANVKSPEKPEELQLDSTHGEQMPSERLSDSCELIAPSAGSPNTPLASRPSVGLPPDESDPCTDTAQICSSPMLIHATTHSMERPFSNANPHENAQEATAPSVDAEPSSLQACESAIAVETKSDTVTVSEHAAKHPEKVSKMHQGDEALNCHDQKVSKAYTSGDSDAQQADDALNLNEKAPIETGEIVPEASAAEKLYQDNAASNSDDDNDPKADSSDSSGESSCSSSSSDSEAEDVGDTLNSFDKAQKETREKLAEAKQAEGLDAVNNVPILSKNELAAENLEVEPITVKISDNDVLHPAGTIQAIMKAKKAVTVNTVASDARPRPVYSIEEIWKACALNFDSLLCFEDRTPLGRVADILGPVDGPMYLVRFNSEEEIDEVSQLKVGAPVFYVEKHSKIVYGKQIHQKGYDTSNMHDEESNTVEYSDDEEERAARKRRTASRLSVGEGDERRAVKQHRSERRGRARRGAIPSAGVSGNPYEQQCFANDGRAFRGTHGNRRGQYAAPHVVPQYGGIVPVINAYNAPQMNYSAPPSQIRGVGPQSFHAPPPPQMNGVGQHHFLHGHAQMLNAQNYPVSQVHTATPENFQGAQPGQYNQVFNGHYYPMSQAAAQPMEQRMHQLPHSFPPPLHPPGLRQTTYGDANGHFQEIRPAARILTPPQFSQSAFPPPPPPEFFDGQRKL